MRALLALSAAALLAGCATPMGGPSRTATELDRLTADCTARGGILTPSGRPFTGYPAVDNECRIHDASRIQQP